MKLSWLVWSGIILIASLMVILSSLTLASQQAETTERLALRLTNQLLTGLHREDRRDLIHALKQAAKEQFLVREWGVYISPAHPLSRPLSRAPHAENFLYRDRESGIIHRSAQGAVWRGQTYEVSVPWRSGRAQISPPVDDVPHARLIIYLNTPSLLSLLKHTVSSRGLILLAQALILSLFSLLLISRFLTQPLKSLSELGHALQTVKTSPIPPLKLGAAELMAVQSSLLTLHHKFRAEQTQLSEAHLALRVQERQMTTGYVMSKVMHEFGNPLSSVIGLVEYVCDDPHVSEEQKEALLLALEELRRMKMMNQQLSRQANAQLELGEAVHFHTLMDWARFILKYHERYSAIELMVSGDLSLQPYLSTNAMKHALLNLLLNAAEAQHGSGVIWIDIQAEAILLDVPNAPRAWKMVIADQGEGIAPHLRSSLFEEGESGTQHGTGLGLSIARSALAQYGIELSLLTPKASEEPHLWARAQRFSGARFVIRGPLERID